MIGSDIGADIVVFEDNVAPRHVQVEFSESLVRLTALADGVLLEGRPLAAGEPVVERLPVVVDLRGVRLSFRTPTPAARTSRSRRPVLLAAVVPITMLLLVPTVAWDGDEPAGQGPSMEALTSPPAPIVPASAPATALAGTPIGLAAQFRPATPDGAPPSVPKPEGAPPQDISAPAIATSALAGRTAAENPAAVVPQAHQAVIAALEQELAQAEITGLSITSTDEAVSIRGAVPPAALDKWRAIHQAIDGRFGQATTIVAAVGISSEKPPAMPRFDAVWAGSDPYVIVRGERFYLGSTIAGGWQVQRITPGEVELRREGRVITINP